MDDLLQSAANDALGEEEEDAYADDFDKDSPAPHTPSDILKSAAAVVQKELREETEEAFQHEAEKIEVAIENRKEEKKEVDEEDEYDHHERRGEMMVASGNDKSIASPKDEPVAGSSRAATIQMSAAEPEPESEDDPDISSESDDGENIDDEQSAIMIRACCRGDIRLVEKAIEKGANIRAQDRHGWTGLHWAAAKGYDDIIHDLVRKVSNKKKFVNTQDRITGWAPLHVACISSQERCVKVLLEYGASKKKLNFLGERAIDCIPATGPATRPIKVMLGWVEKSEKKDESKSETKDKRRDSKSESKYDS